MPPASVSASPISGRTDSVADPSHFAAHVANWFAELVNAADRPVRVALCGGSTPRALYTLLGSPAYRTCVAWDRVHLFWGDERFVPHADAQSNYRMVQETLLAHAPIPLDQIYPMPVTGDPDSAAQAYQLILQRAYGADVLDPSRPLFDVNFLGLGTDGHTASLLPGQPVLQEKSRWVAAVPHGRENSRLTLTYPALESSAVTAFLVTGTEKAAVVQRARAADATIPAGALRPNGEVIWFLDFPVGEAMELDNRSTP
ncbi:MAG: 6-phosphogluconolactonase [Herminiimonas sp.]|nr:6-phosphogluconolactonase [Herminiimonas sp.]